MSDEHEQWLPSASDQEDMTPDPYREIGDLRAALAQAQEQVELWRNTANAANDMTEKVKAELDVLTAKLAAMERERDRECRRADGYMDWINECAKTLDGKSPLETKQQLAAMEKELHDAKTQCGKNAISHMTQYHRADSLQQQLASAQQERDECKLLVMTLDRALKQACVEIAEFREQLQTAREQQARMREAHHADT